MNRPESKSAIIFRHWIMANPSFTYSLETKDTRGSESFPFSEVSQAQLDFGLAIKHSKKGVLIRTQATVEGVPDYIYLKNEPARIAIKYPKGFVLIDVETFIQEKARSRRKSLTWDRAKEIAIKVVTKKKGGEVQLPC